MITSRHSQKPPSGFTLVELIVVMAIITILVSVGAVGIGRMDEAQKTNTSIALVEALTNEAQRTAVGNNTKARLCIVNDVTDSDRHLRYFAIATFDEVNSVWVIKNRGTTIPNGAYFDPARSTINNNEIGTFGNGTGIDFPGNGVTTTPYYYYEFNALGICIDSDSTTPNPGASLVLIGGYLKSGQPEIKGNDKAGFIIWRNGSTSRVRDLSQIP